VVLMERSRQRDREARIERTLAAHRRHAEGALEGAFLVSRLISLGVAITWMSPIG
jgi:hypothetical protein